MLFLLLQPDFALTLNVSTHGTATIFFLYSTFVWESLDDTNLSCLVPSYHLRPERRKNNLDEAGNESRSSCLASDWSIHYTIAPGHQDAMLRTQ